MCAIFGTIGKADLNLIKKISKKQIYRGPDEQNFYESNDKLVSLGNNRLSVIDAEKGKQPRKKDSETEDPFPQTCPRQKGPQLATPMPIVRHSHSALHDSRPT